MDLKIPLLSTMHYFSSINDSWMLDENWILIVRLLNKLLLETHTELLKQAIDLHSGWKLDAYCFACKNLAFCYLDFGLFCNTTTRQGQSSIYKSFLYSILFLVYLLVICFKKEFEIGMWLHI